MVGLLLSVAREAIHAHRAVGINSSIDELTRFPIFDSTFHARAWVVIVLLTLSCVSHSLTIT